MIGSHQQSTSTYTIFDPTSQSAPLTSVDMVGRRIGRST